MLTPSPTVHPVCPSGNFRERKYEGHKHHICMLLSWRTGRMIDNVVKLLQRVWAPCRIVSHIVCNLSTRLHHSATVWYPSYKTWNINQQHGPSWTHLLFAGFSFSEIWIAQVKYWVTETGQSRCTKTLEHRSLINNVIALDNLKVFLMHTFTCRRGCCSTRCLICSRRRWTWWRLWSMGGPGSARHPNFAVGTGMRAWQALGRFSALALRFTQETGYSRGEVAAFHGGVSSQKKNRKKMQTNAQKRYPGYIRSLFENMRGSLSGKRSPFASQATSLALFLCFK